MIKITLLGAILCGTLAVSAAADALHEKPAIVLTAFGTSVPEARMVFEHIEKAARDRYPGYDVRWAFTSETIIKKLKEQGTETYSVADVIEQLKQAGYTKAVFQSMHIVPGQEYSSVEEAVKGVSLKTACGTPLMTSDADVDAVIDALACSIRDGVPNVLVTHGNDKNPQFNERLLAVEEKAAAKYDNLFAASVEGQPGTACFGKVRERAKEAGGVHFIPLMLVAGDHIMNDVMGDEPESWKNQIAAKETTCAESIGWNDAILSIYFDHLDAAMKDLVEKND